MFQIARLIMLLAMGLFIGCIAAAAAMTGRWSLSGGTVLVIFLAARRGRNLWAFGTAKTATANDLYKAHMLDGRPGLVLGWIENPWPSLAAAIVGLTDLRLSSQAA